MLIQYTPKRFGSAALATIASANQIIEEYQAQGFDLTLRQLYYQFVSRDLIPNSQKEYKKLGEVISSARLAGLVSWEAIVDRTRNLQKNAHWNSPSEIVRACVNQYRIDKWAEQSTRVEVWIEKDALIGVIESICGDLDVSYFSCRGYTSQSEMWSAAQRLIGYRDQGQDVVIIHLGDHDPSGKDMTRDIQDRLNLFMRDDGPTVERIALNMDQVRKYNPPPNPAKITDSRAHGYIREFGSKSWELDALDPNVLRDLIESTVLEHRDVDAWEAAAAREDKERKQLEKAAKGLK